MTNLSTKSQTAARENFAFDAVFHVDEGRLTDVPAPKKRFTPQEVEEVEARALADGRQSVEAQAAASASASLSQIAEAVAAATADLSAHRETLANDAARLALAAARLLSRRIAEGFAAEEIASSIAEIVSDLSDSPHIEVRAPAGCCDDVQALLEENAQALPALSRLTLTPDPTLGAPDCRIVWAEGSAQHDQAALEERVARIVTARIGGEKEARP
ncbi:MAG: hypothetical protein AAF527_02560 [Pseudomonadota bacterium]